METPELDIHKIVDEYADSVVQSIAVAQRMGMLESEEDLKQLIAAGMEVAVEDVLVQITEINSKIG